MKVVVTDMFLKGLQRLNRSRWHPAKLWYSFKCWAWHRYSTVKSRHLSHEWADRTAILPYTMFEILEQFVERECSPGIVKWYGSNPHKIMVELPGGVVVEKNVRDEMKDLCVWWNRQYHGRYKRLEEKIWFDFERLQDRYHVSDFETGMRDSDDCRHFWDPQYSTPWAKERAEELLRRLNLLERAADAALTRRMHRIVKLTPYLWT